MRLQIPAGGDVFGPRRVRRGPRVTISGRDDDKHAKNRSPARQRQCGKIKAGEKKTLRSKEQSCDIRSRAYSTLSAGCHTRNARGRAAGLPWRRSFIHRRRRSVQIQLIYKIHTYFITLDINRINSYISVFSTILILYNLLMTWININSNLFCQPKFRSLRNGSAVSRFHLFTCIYELICIGS